MVNPQHDPTGGAAPDEPVDIALYGATGFVGALTARYLAEHAPAGVRIALAGRSEAKLAAARAALPERAKEWPLIVADASDRAATDRLAGAARVVLTTVGPYAKYGRQLVESCARAGTHYADLTGEVLFVRDAVDRCHGIAESTGARIVHSCGYDSVPSDLGGVARAHRRRGRRRRRPHRGPDGRDDAGRCLRRDGRLAARPDRRRPRRPVAAPAGGRPARAEPGPGDRADAVAARRRGPAEPARRRHVDRAVRHGVLQHPDRAPLQRAARPRLRPRPAVRRAPGLRPRDRRCRRGGRRDRRARCAGGCVRDRTGPPAAGPRAARPRERAVGADPGLGLVPDGRPRDDGVGAPLPRPGVRAGRPGVRRDRRHARGERARAGAGRVRAAGPGGLPDPGDGDGGRARRPPAGGRAHLRGLGGLTQP
ncbi:Carboxynorspermidine dehydrogenase [Pseudonocardia sp. Ae168_Ps1]|nr:Carboxynorspermidine dehydrogenase [Pseudonocardia sp. Ae150A_Ps1]OLL81893.1 Carboxynorspermidine dehydrogenase [Pseudonocardia sp. Ae168_Ps1]OLL83994.1 Carboxynorspermidine dehydrogenase [Pseudonocardia sp. Ae263_Ps1]OLL95986.1 Carboxynorspermidine dehydrogenase [Pseudonocardia sp. Ae356_Ps1]